MEKLINITPISNEFKRALDDISEILKLPLIMKPFYKDFSYTFCWSSNAIEGNTLTLEDTINLLEDDTVSPKHSYREHEEAKLLYIAINKYLSLEQPYEMNEEWIQNLNRQIIGSDYRGYREGDVYIGNALKAVYYPPSHENVPALMKEYAAGMNFVESDMDKVIELAALKHVEFERIHPFGDGNGRTGRVILNQMLINNGLLPISIKAQSKYRQSFKQYDKNQDLSLLEHIIFKGELEAIDNIKELHRKYRER